MKGLQIDILGEAPTIKEIENYNDFHGKRGLLWLVVVFFIIIASCSMLVSPSSWVSSNLILIDNIDNVYYSLVVLGIFFVFLGWKDLGEIEEFISSNRCIHFSQLIAKYPEVALYRDQVVAHGREFLQSEYIACTRILERRACREIYKVETNSTMMVDTTA